MGRFDEVDEENRILNMMNAQAQVAKRPGLIDAHGELHTNLEKLDDLINQLVDRLDVVLIHSNPQSMNESGGESPEVSQAVDFIYNRICDVRRMQDKVIDLTHRVNL